MNRDFFRLDQQDMSCFVLNFLQLVSISLPISFAMNCLPRQLSCQAKRIYTILTLTSVRKVYIHTTNAFNLSTHTNKMSSTHFVRVSILTLHNMLTHTLAYLNTNIFLLRHDDYDYSMPLRRDDAICFDDDAIKELTKLYLYHGFS